MLDLPELEVPLSRMTVPCRVTAGTWGSVRSTGWPVAVAGDVSGDMARILP